MDTWFYTKKKPIYQRRFKMTNTLKIDLTSKIVLLAKMGRRPALVSIILHKAFGPLNILLSFPFTSLSRTPLSVTTLSKSVIQL